MKFKKNSSSKDFSNYVDHLLDKKIEGKRGKSIPLSFQEIPLH